MKKYIDFNTEIANIAKEFLKYVSKPTFISQKIVSEDFANLCWIYCSKKYFKKF